MFKDIIEKLIRSGMTESGIAAKVGSSQPSINRIRNGKQQPGYVLGDALLKLAGERCPVDESPAADQQEAAA